MSTLKIKTWNQFLLRLLIVAGSWHLLFGLAGQTFAGLIDRTPGGYEFTIGRGPPPALLELFTLETRNMLAFFDEARVIPFVDRNGQLVDRGWVSQYGVLNGGSLFSTNLFDFASTPNATVFWNFGGVSGDKMRWINVFGTADDGTGWEHLYEVSFHSMLDSNGPLPITLNGQVRIGSISFYGSTPFTIVPEGGTTLALFAMSLVAIASWARMLRRG